MPVEFKIAADLEELSKAFAVRCIVFCGEQDVPYTVERDKYDVAALHIVGQAGGEPMAAARIRFDADCARLERIAIVKAYRGKGYGDQLMQFMLQTCADRGYRKTKLHAQTHALAYYEKYGFVAEGEVFLDGGIEHLRMYRGG
ncbi:MAG: GNAT family N-acetyltransferase [Pseudomonadales bacterium]